MIHRVRPADDVGYNSLDQILDSLIRYTFEIGSLTWCVELLTTLSSEALMSSLKRWNDSVDDLRKGDPFLRMRSTSNA